MSDRAFTSEQALNLLAAHPRRLAALTDGLTHTQLHTPPTEGAWSINDVLAHLRACADMWGGCMARMIAEEKPTLRAINPRTWIKRTDYLQQDFAPSLRAFTAQRADLLAQLGSLPPDGWLRSATVTGAGATLQRTVLFYGDWLARHERTHVRQVERIARTLRR